MLSSGDTRAVVCCSLYGTPPIRHHECTLAVLACMHTHGRAEPACDYIDRECLEFRLTIVCLLQRTHSGMSSLTRHLVSDMTHASLPPKCLWYIRTECHNHNIIPAHFTACGVYVYLRQFVYIGLTTVYMLPCVPRPSSLIHSTYSV